MPFLGSSLKVGALVEPLTAQMADYLGMQNGLMVKQVARKSEAAAAVEGLRRDSQGGTGQHRHVSDWDRSLRSNQGKPVQVTILRDKKQQTLTLQVDSKHRQGTLQKQEVTAEGDSAFIGSGEDLLFDPQQIEQWNKQMGEFSKSLTSGGFKFNQKQLDEFRRQMEQWRDSDSLCLGDYV